MWDVLLTDDDALDRIGEMWTELWARTLPVPPMLELGWIREWWRLHRQEGQLFMVLVLDERRRPLGLAPLYRRLDPLTPRTWLRTLCLLGTGERERDEVTGEYTTWLGAPEALPLVSQRV